MSPSSASDALVRAVRADLAAHADPGRAPGMQAYMKSAMPYRGVPSPLQRQIYRRLFAAHPLPDARAWRAAVLSLWRGAAFREERYAAIELLQAKRYAAHQTLDALDLFEEIVVDGAWWDTVDAVATHGLGALLKKYPRPMRRTLLAWSRDPHLWKRRSAIICQVGFKKDTDLELLYAAIEPNLADKDFFIRKAIGWALRAYAWTDAREVVRYVREHEHALSGLSRREALKNVPSAAAGKAKAKARGKASKVTRTPSAQ